MILIFYDEINNSLIHYVVKKLNIMHTKSVFIERITIYKFKKNVRRFSRNSFNMVE